MYQQPVAAPAINSASDAIGFPFRDPQWVSKILIQGLINIIPVVGLMAGLGWTLATLDNLRQGRQELAPAGFGHLGRGAGLFVVALVYSALVGVVFLIFWIVAVGLTSTRNEALGAIGVIFILIAYLLAFAGGLALQFAFPTIVLAVDRGGVGAGLNFAQILATIRGNSSTALMAGLFSFLLYLIAGFGQIACFVGFYLTLAWAMAGLAAVVYWEERNLRPAGEAMQSPQSMPPPPSIPPPPSA